VKEVVVPKTSEARRSTLGAIRRDRLLEHIRKKEALSVGELAALLEVSPVTIHRDLGQLQADGLIVRVHGGARPVEPRADEVVTDWEIRLGRMCEAKQAMAAEVRSYIEEDSSVFLDASTTCFAALKQIERDPPRSLRLVTNSPAIAYTVRSPGIHVAIVPGDLNQDLRAVVGPWAIDFLRELSLDLALVSGAGFTVDRGLTTTNRDLRDLLRAALRASKRAVALVDSSKVGRARLMSAASPQEFDAVIVDSGIESGLQAELRRAGVPLRVARPRNG